MRQTKRTRPTARVWFGSIRTLDHTILTLNSTMTHAYPPKPPSDGCTVSAGSPKGDRIGIPKPQTPRPLALAQQSSHDPSLGGADEAWSRQPTPLAESGGEDSIGARPRRARPGFPATRGQLVPPRRGARPGRPGSGRAARALGHCRYATESLRDSGRARSYSKPSPPPFLPSLGFLEKAEKGDRVTNFRRLVVSRPRIRGGIC